MILVDANLLVYAHVRSFQQHEKAHAWLDSQFNGNSRVGLPWQSLLAFLRIVTNPRIFQMAETISDAWKQVEEWLDCEAAWIPEPTERHRDVLGYCCKRPACKRTSCPTPILPHSPSSTDSSSAPPTETSLVFKIFAGTTR
jgi:toxin-antitoxin system PIN domain toxin